MKKLLLTAGLLIVLGQGLCQLPELQDYLFPVDHRELMLTQARKECRRLEADMSALSQRLDYLTWFQAHNGPDQKISAVRLRTFPFSESIRSLAPEFFWHTNIRLAHKNRLSVERKLLYLQGLLKDLDGDAPVHPAHASPAIPGKPGAVSASAKQLQQFQNQWEKENAKLKELSKQLSELENNDNKK
jgi:hypothetical protein